MSIREVFCAVLLSAASMTGSADASTLTEVDGDFSNSWVAPTVVASGTTDVSGAGASGWSNGDQFDVLQFSGLAPGRTSIFIDFTLTGSYRTGNYANGGGSIYYSFVPFTGSYYVTQADGKVLGSKDLLAGAFDVTYDPWKPANPLRQGTSRFTLDLGDEFAGNLFLALNFTYGKTSYNVNALNWPASDEGTTVSPVPLPASGLFLLASFLGLGCFAIRRKRR